MSNTVEKNFSGFVKVVIGATSLLAMGAVVAGGALVKGFQEGAKAVRKSLNDQDEKTDAKAKKAENATTSDATEETIDEGTSDEHTED